MSPDTHQDVAPHIRSQHDILAEKGLKKSSTRAVWRVPMILIFNQSNDKRGPTPKETLVRFAALLLACAVWPGCGPPAAGPGAPAAQEKASGSRYIVRGEIVRLPAAGAETAQLMIRHEAIPDFVNKTGEKVGMQAMTMAFQTAAGVSLQGFQVGDKIEFGLRVDWENNTYEILELKKLPPDTPLKFKPGGHEPMQ
jgi:Cu/Ag efflux protein CusF